MKERVPFGKCAREKNSGGSSLHGTKEKTVPEPRRGNNSMRRREAALTLIWQKA